MKENTTELWFSWFYKNWEKYNPGDLLESGLSPSQIAERFVNENHNEFIKTLNNFHYDFFSSIKFG